MPDEATLDRRLRAVERSLTDGDHDVATVRDAGRLTERVETLETELEDARDRIAELEAATQALRGYVGNVRSVNDDVEQRADAALAAVDRLEQQLGGQERGGPTGKQRRKRASNDDQRRTHTGAQSQRSGPVSTASRSVIEQSSTTDAAPSESVSSNGSGAEEDTAGIVQRVREVL